MPSKRSRKAMSDSAKGMYWRQVIWRYCWIAIGVLLMIGVAVVVSTSDLRQASLAAQHELARAEEQVQSHESEVAQLEEGQRQQRAGLSGPEAVELSAKVQVAQAARDAAVAQRDAVKGQAVAANDAYQVRMTKLVPVIALLLLHALGLLLFPPRPGPRTARPQ